MRRFIFACIHNAGRSQMSAAFFNEQANPLTARAISAGTQPAEAVHPVVIEVMLEVGVDLTQVRPQKLTEELVRQAELLITTGCGEECPFVPGLRRLNWPIRDPRGLPLDEVRMIRNEIRRRVSSLIEDELLQPTPSSAAIIPLP